MTQNNAKLQSVIVIVSICLLSKHCGLMGHSFKSGIDCVCQVLVYLVNVIQLNVVLQLVIIKMLTIHGRLFNG